LGLKVKPQEEPQEEQQQHNNNNQTVNEKLGICHITWLMPPIVL
jgi:hypothetical protein